MSQQPPTTIKLPQHTPTEVRERAALRRALPARLKSAIETATDDDTRRLLQDAWDEVTSSREKTAEEIGFTYEPTGERVRLFAPSLRSFQIVADNPAVMRALSVCFSTRLSTTPYG